MLVVIYINNPNLKLNRPPPLYSYGHVRFEAFCDLQSCDLVHPNAAGYSILAAAVFRAYVDGPPLPPQ